VQQEKSYEEVKRGASQKAIDKMIENLMKQKERIVKQIKVLKNRVSSSEPTSPALLQLKALNSQLASIDAQILKAIQEKEKLDKMA
jgi:hypothetical protein